MAGDPTVTGTTTATNAAVVVLCLARIDSLARLHVELNRLEEAEGGLASTEFD